MARSPPVTVDQITTTIHVLHGHRVMLDADLPRLYGVETKALNRAVRRNASRFPGDFMFRLTSEEAANLKYQFGTSSLPSDPNLKSQTVTSSAGWGGRRKLPSAFTEHGAVMLASVLNSATAVHASIQVVRAFVQLRSILAAHADLARKLEQMEQRYDAQFKVVFDAIRELMRPTEGKPIGFRS